MAKKTKEPAVEIPKVKKMKTVENYSIGKWKGFDQFKCKLCAFDTLEEELIKAHIIEAHMPKPIKPAVKVQLFDRFDNKIN